MTDRLDSGAVGGHSDRPTASAAVGDNADRPDALGRCVADPTAFADYWGRRPLLTRAVDLPAAFTDLLDADAVDELVSRRGLRTPFLRMARDGNVISGGRFTRSGGAGASTTDQVADDLVLGLIGDGATLVLQALHRTWPPLVTFASRLAAELGHPVQVNAYITPPQNQGFAPHYDVHDVFVLQVAGRKQWHVHEPVLADPLSTQPWDQRKDAVAAQATGPASIDTVLEPGDALYLPRGYIHSATALGETSIHLTVGIHPRTRHHLVEHLLRGVAEEAELRTSLPSDADLGDPAVLAPHLKATVEALHRYLDQVPPERIAEQVADDLLTATRPEPLGPLAQLAAADQLDTETRLRLRPGLRHRLDPDSDHIRLRVLGKTLSVPTTCAAALRRVLTGAVFTPAELPDLEPDEAVVLSRRLLRDGVVVPVGR